MRDQTEIVQCDDVTAAGTRCARAGDWTSAQLLIRGKCYQHCVAAHRARGAHTMIDLRSARLVDVREISTPSRQFVAPTSFEGVLSALATVRTFDELTAVIHVVHMTTPSMPGYGDEFSPLRQAIVAARDRIRGRASAAVLEANPPAAPETHVRPHQRAARRFG